MKQVPLIMNHFPLVLAILVLFLAVVGPVSQAEESPLKNTYEGIEIVGPSEFQTSVEKALKLLSGADPQEYAKVLKFVQKIYLGAHSRIHLSDHPGQFELHPKTAYGSSPWLASVFVHEACHAAEYRRRQGRLVINSKSEVTCNQAQAEVLRKVGGTEAQVDYLKQADGRHYDIDKDGRYTKEDRLNQDW